MEYLATQGQDEHLARLHTHAGWIEVIAGSMFSGKSEELIRRLRRAKIARQRVQVFKPEIDERYSRDHIVSHSEMRHESRAVRTAAEIPLRSSSLRPRSSASTRGSFFDSDLVSVVNELADRGVRVIVAGPDQDYTGRPFGPMPHLLAVAEYITKTHAICVRCGQPANYSQRTVEVEARSSSAPRRLRGPLPPLLSSPTPTPPPAHIE